MSEPVDQDIVNLLRQREGQRTDVVLEDGKIFRVFNIAWGYDEGDQYAHVTTNISPDVDGESIGFFYTNHVVRILVPEDGHELYARSNA